MKKSNILIKILQIAVCAGAITLFFPGCSKSGTGQNTAIQKTAEPDWRDYNGKRIGVLYGTPMEKVAYDYFPDSEYEYLNSYPDCNAALLAGKIDAYLGDEPGIRMVRNEQPKIDYIHDRISDQDYSFAFRKNDPKSAALCEELNDFIDKIRSDGTLQEIDDIWFGTDEDKKVVDMSDLTGENGKIRVVTTATDVPWSYIKDGKNVGYDIDLIVRFCRERGYSLELGDVEFGARIPALKSGKYDFTTDMNVTPEREEEVLFSKPTGNGGIVLAIRSDDKENGGADKTGDITSISMLNDPSKTIGVGMGDASENAVKEALPNANIVYLNGVDMYKALQTEKVDALAYDYIQMQMAMQGGISGVKLFDETIGQDIPIAVGTSPETKIPDLPDKINRFIDELRSDGTLDDMYKRWVVDKDETMPEIPLQKSASQHLIVGTTGLVRPYTYYTGTELNGYDIELAYRFAAWLGADIEFKVYDYGAIVIATNTGDVDCAMANLNVTPERSESMIFSQPLFVNRTGVMIRDTQEAANTADEGFIKSIANSFEKTFIRESRWKLFVSGIGTTLLITVVAVAAGTLLGFGVYLACRRGNPAANMITKFSVWLVQGMPVVVLLMILYYIVFKYTPVSGTFVSIVGFTLVFGASVYGQLCVGVLSEYDSLGYASNYLNISLNLITQDNYADYTDDIAAGSSDTGTDSSDWETEGV